MAFGLPSRAGAAPITKSFAFTGGAQEYVVPAGVCAVELDVLGAEGGDFDGDIVAGQGGRATSIIDVTPGEVLAVYVGGRPVGLAGGFNGGGAAGVSTNNASMVPAAAAPPMFARVVPISRIGSWRRRRRWPQQRRRKWRRRRRSGGDMR